MSNGESSDQRVRMYIESIGESPHGFAQMVVRADVDGGRRFVFDFPNGWPPYASSGQYFFVTELSTKPSNGVLRK